VTFAHHDAASGDQRRSGEAELVGAQQRADGHIAPSAQAAIDLTAMRPRSSFSTSVCCVSASPISQASPHE